MVTGFNVATVNHDSRIDWLEVRITLLLCLLVFLHVVHLDKSHDTLLIKMNLDYFVAQ